MNQNDQFQQQQEQLFYQAIISNDVTWITSFLQDLSTSNLYPKFLYSIQKDYLPNDCQVTPIIIAILHNKLSIVQLLIQHQIQQQQYDSQHLDHDVQEPSTTTSAISTTIATQEPTQPSASFNPSKYKEHGLPLFHYAIASESIEMMDYILSLYSASPMQSTTSSTTPTLQSSTSSSSSSPPQLQMLDIDSIYSDYGNPLQFALKFLELEQIRYLIENYACNPLIQDSSKKNILHFATTLKSNHKSNSIEIFDYLMSLDGVKDLLDQHDINRFTPVAAAVLNNNHNLFNHLVLQYNPDINKVFHNNKNLLHLSIQSNNNLDFIDDIIQLNPKFITSTNNHGHTPFLTAVYLNKINIIQHLIQQHHVNPLITSITNNTVLHYVAQSTVDSIEMFEYLLLLDGVKDLLEHENEDGNTPLLILSSKNKSICFRYLIEKHNASTQCQNNLGETVAHWFSYHGHIEMIDYIHNINPDLIHQQNSNDSSPLFIAIMNNQLVMAKHLIKQYNVDHNGVTTCGENVLHLATGQGSIELVDYIISLLNSSFIESTDIFARTPLFFASGYSNIDVFHHLINQYNANPFVLNCSNCNIMHAAVHSNNAELIKSIPTIFENQQPPTTLQFTLPNGYPRLTGEWFDHGQSPLHYAIQQSKLAGVKQLVRLKANITTTNHISKLNPNFSTILQYSYYFASQKNNYSIFQYLLSDECLEDWNSEKELKFNDDETTIQVYGQKDPIQPQLEMKYPRTQYTLLLYAASKCDFTAMKLLIRRGANVYAADADWSNFLHLLVNTASKDQQSQDNILNFINCLSSLLPTITITKLLTKKTLKNRATPLLVAARFSSFPIVQQLINLKANIDEVNGLNNSLLHRASFNSNSSMVSNLLIHYHQSIQNQLYQRNEESYTPFHIAIYANKVNSTQNKEIITNDNTNSDDDEFNFYNPDISTYIQHDPSLLLQKATKSNRTIFHIAVDSQVELPTRLAGLIEAVIDNIDIIAL